MEVCKILIHFGAGKGPCTAKSMIWSASYNPTSRYLPIPSCPTICRLHSVQKPQAPAGGNHSTRGECMTLNSWGKSSYRVVRAIVLCTKLKAHSKSFPPCCRWSRLRSLLEVQYTVLPRLLPSRYSITLSPYSWGSNRR